MAKLEITTEVRITNVRGETYSVHESVDISIGDNPSFWAESAGGSAATLAQRVRPALAHRFGDRPAKNQEARA